VKGPFSPTEKRIRVAAGAMKHRMHVALCGIELLARLVEVPAVPGATLPYAGSRGKALKATAVPPHRDGGPRSGAAPVWGAMEDDLWVMVTSFGNSVIVNTLLSLRTGK